MFVLSAILAARWVRDYTTRKILRNELWRLVQSPLGSGGALWNPGSPHNGIETDALGVRADALWVKRESRGSRLHLEDLP